MFIFCPIVWQCTNVNGEYGTLDVHDSQKNNGKVKASQTLSEATLELENGFRGVFMPSQDRSSPSSHDLSQLLADVGLIADRYVGTAKFRATKILYPVTHTSSFYPLGAAWDRKRMNLLEAIRAFSRSKQKSQVRLHQSY